MRQIDELEALREIRDLLLPPQNWIQGVYAREDKNLNYPPLYGYDESATCWCLEGAVQRVYGDIQEFGTDAGKRLYKLAKSKGRSSVTDFNDHSNHIEVLALVDEAIAQVIAERTRGAA